MKNTHLLSRRDTLNSFTSALKSAIEQSGPVMARLRNGVFLPVSFRIGDEEVGESAGFIHRGDARYYLWDLNGASIHSSELDLIEFTQAEPAVPAPGSPWTHRKSGASYKVLLLTNESADRTDDFPVTVVYQGADGKVWSRPLAEWHGAMMPAPN